ncbi:MAG: hypothetical protein A2W05_09765 [Candidatus Schekmanbacteria bacterium RBG_16_38_10]|uniref:Uncharacterized protein n=1 Tax=Candidatus Schekmanbacteria bacterium RBG_16_38_10 TaxID=1817879 RepID=A0A1F7S0N1_9BACT|nr:MAG: hypothetical protein A2W05_09765 [Candidatus Schekmanbacteria bacterium RBG_16_38_10]
MVTVLNLSNLTEQVYTCSPEEAVIAAYAQSTGDFNTWDYDARYSRLLEWGEHCVLCGDFSSFYCECHNHVF